MHAYLDSIGLLGPGLNDWTQARDVLAGRAPYVSAPTELLPPACLPSAERRRSGPPVRLSIGVGQQAVTASGMDAASLATIFASSGSDGFNIHAICEGLAEAEPVMSPTRFHNSVHNAPAGYWSIATGAMRPSNVICAYDGSFGAGLLESVAQVTVDGEPCLLIAYDTDYPEPLRAHRPIEAQFGVALLLTPAPTPRTLAALAVRTTHEAAARMPDAALEALRGAVPAARALPLLRALAMQQAGIVVLDYLDELRLAVEVSPTGTP